MLHKKIEDQMNLQIEREEYSSNLYLAMAVWAERSGLPGFSDWLYAQANEERLHMLKFVKYINERGGKALIGAVNQPPAEYKDIEHLFKQVLEHEQFISQSINDLVGICNETKDFSTHSWLQFFVNEQIEEEASVQLIIDKIKLVGVNNLYMFDRDIMTLRQASAV